MITVVREGFDKREAAGWIAGEAKKKIGADDRDRFIEIIETELGSLHDGNIARYRPLSPAIARYRPLSLAIGRVCTLERKLALKGRRGGLGTPGHSSTPKT